MDALATGWAGRMDIIMVWTWMHWPMDGLVAWTWNGADLKDEESSRVMEPKGCIRCALILYKLNALNTKAYNKPLTLPGPKPEALNTIPNREPLNRQTLKDKSYMLL